MSNESPDQDWEQEEKPERHRSSRHRERKQSLEEQVLNVAKDDIQKARELVMIRKELLRLHYKVKNYHNQTRLANGIIQLVIVALLLVVLYRLYTI
jgi:hypothetical protein